jgi:hypothetical protein
MIVAFLFCGWIELTTVENCYLSLHKMDYFYIKRNGINRSGTTGKKKLKNG